MWWRANQILLICKLDIFNPPLQTHNTPYLKVNGIIENNQLIRNIHLPVSLHQAVWIEPKHRFLWWRWGVKALHQTISSDNPYVEIKYSEMIEIGNLILPIQVNQPSGKLVWWVRYYPDNKVAIMPTQTSPNQLDWLKYKADVICLTHHVCKTENNLLWLSF